MLQNFKKLKRDLKNFAKKQKKRIFNSLIVPKNLKGTLWDFLTFVLLQNTKKMKGGIFGDMKKNCEKSHKAEITCTILAKGETRTHVLLLGRTQIILINTYAKFQKLRQVLEVGQLPEVVTAAYSDYATCGLKRESCRAEKKHRHLPITLAYRKCNNFKSALLRQINTTHFEIKARDWDSVNASFRRRLFFKKQCKSGSKNQ